MDKTKETKLIYICGKWMSAPYRSENLQKKKICVPHLNSPLQSCHNCYYADTIKVDHCLLILRMDDWQENPLDSWATTIDFNANDIVPE